jgi:hypothetical protein
MLADLVAQNVFAGRNTEAMRNIIALYVSDPAFMAEYLADATNERQHERKIRVMNEKLAAAGVETPAAPAAS